MSRPRPVPPAPHVLAHLYMEYIRDGKPYGLTFRQYLRAIGFTDPAARLDGMDDSLTVRRDRPGGPLQVSVPRKPVTGPIRIIVLLIDFEDRPGSRPADEYRDLLFSDGVFPTGSLLDFYREVSGGKVLVSGTVHGWLRLPQPYSSYTNNESGMRAESYPRNAQRMAEDAVEAARAAGVEFPAELDALHDGTVTGLFVVHAGPGAETLNRLISGRSIWSHKWVLRTPADVGGGLFAATYLTVPEDCRMGVCAHELGHLAFQWEDFYDPNGGDDGVQWSGTGRWDLMAGGSWNGDLGNRPAHPIGLHKSQHGWVEVETVKESKTGVTVRPYTAAGGTVVKVVSPAYAPDEFLLLENRRRTGFDDRLPGEGLLVWRVDLVRDQDAPFRPAVQLVQADGRQDLENSANLNQGDDGDPFPQPERTEVGDSDPLISTSFPGDPRSGITLKNITRNPDTGEITLDVVIASLPPSTPPDSTAAPLAAAAGGRPPAGTGRAPQPSATQPTGGGPVADAGAAPAQPVHPLVAGLDNLLRQAKSRQVSPEELAPIMEAVTPTVMQVEQQVRMLVGPEPPAPGGAPKGPAATPTAAPAAAPIAAPAAAPDGLDNPKSFDSWLWRQYLSTVKPAWAQLGKFSGDYTLRDTGPVDYVYIPNGGDEFTFTRKNGERITPRQMVTDGGSVPRPAWVIPDIDPRTYLRAYVLHDWLFVAHHCYQPGNPANTFERANQVLAEAIFTLMAGPPDPAAVPDWWKSGFSADWRKIVMIYTAVSSFVGRRVWGRQWDAKECKVALPGGLGPAPPGT